MRLLILLHRYLGLGIGFIIVLWCLSGFVMMYVQYPAYTQAEQLADLEAIDFSRCCEWPVTHSSAQSVEQAIVESELGTPVLTLWSGGAVSKFDLAAGAILVPVDSTRAARLVESIAGRRGVAAEFLGELQRDQWTVASDFHPHRPLFKFAARDQAGTEWYVSGSTGRVVQKTDAAERFWNWLGSVPHWIYPTELRRHVVAWSQTVIWLSIAGTFLAVTGLYVGVSRLLRGRGSPYSGWFLWHHYIGLVFGLFTLSWMFSGLLSMNPFGVFESRSFAQERAHIRGGDVTLAQMKLTRETIEAMPPATVRLTASMFAGEFAWLAWNGAGKAVRIGTALTDTRLRTRAAGAANGMPIDSAEMIDAPDAYYYSHHESRPFPVMRVIYRNGERLYLDPVSGELLHAVDTSRRWSRWLFLALHRGDFAAWARQRPVWDVLMLLLLAGVTLGAATGAVLAWKRMARAVTRRT